MLPIETLLPEEHSRRSLFPVGPFLPVYATWPFTIIHNNTDLICTRHSKVYPLGRMREIIRGLGVGRTIWLWHVRIRARPGGTAAHCRSSRKLSPFEI
jgi:hypothetical protein